VLLNISSSPEALESRRYYQAPLDAYEIYEYACDEGNHGLANVLSAARAQ
jgi:hypothetical protein